MPDDTMTLHSHWRAAVLAIVVALPAVAFVPVAVAAGQDAAKAHYAIAKSFATSDAASEALIAAVRSQEPRRINEILGPGSSKLIRSGDPVADRQARERFIAAYEAQARIEPDGETKATLLIGKNDWPFPLPLVKVANGWRFDAKAGASEILNRRIGRNELSAIQVCLAYVDAQREYASTTGNDNGVHAYAMKFASSRGNKDGLYWPTSDGQPLSPLGPLVAKAQAEGYDHQPYHGYYYRILTSQGGDAVDGVYDYVVNGRMIGGFALVAYPARWGASGVMTFIVNHDGVVYQSNLGTKTFAIASRMKRFNPDSTWSKVQQ